MMKLNVCMITYNQEKYIAQAIEGVLMQKTNFKFNLIISDDSSTDKTKSIIEKYKKKFQSKVSVHFSKSNLGMMKNFLQNLDRCDAEYVALCEGDDYWTDPNKLQIQVNFLEENRKYSICAHNVKVVYENSKHPATFWLGAEHKTTSSLEDRLRFGSGGATCSLVFRNKIYGQYPDEFKLLPGADWILQILCSSKGLMYYYSKPMAVYRRNPSGVSSVRVGTQAEIDIYDAGGLQMCNAINKYFNYKYDILIRQNLATYFYPNLISIYLRNKKYHIAYKYIKILFKDIFAVIPFSIKTLFTIFFLCLPNRKQITNLSINFRKVINLIYFKNNYC